MNTHKVEIWFYVSYEGQLDVKDLHKVLNKRLNDLIENDDTFIDDVFDCAGGDVGDLQFVCRGT